MKKLFIMAVCLLTLIITSCQKQVINIESNNNLIIDTTFKSNLGFDGNVYAISNLPTNDILAGGSFIESNGYISPRFAKLNSKGEYLPIVASSGFNGTVTAIATQSDGKILIGGAFNIYEGINFNRIIRLNTNGSIDETFKTGQGFFGSGLYGAFGKVNTIAIQSDGKILVGGDFTIYGNTKCGRIIRLNQDGSIDGSFPVPVGFNNSVNVIKIINQEFAYIGGDFTTYTDGDVNVVKANRLIKLSLADASVDYSFVTNNGFDSTIFSAEIQSDGKLIVGGAFNSYQGYAINGILRLNANGSTDNTFAVGKGFNATVYSILIDNSKNKIIVGGEFTQYNLITCNRIVKLNTDASVDKTWNYGNGFNSSVYALSFNSTKTSIITGGAFTYFDKVKANRIAKLNL